MFTALNISLFVILICLHPVRNKYVGDEYITEKPLSDPSLDWSSWSYMSRCSKSCDGGLAYKLRNCLNESGCIGGNIIYEICNTQKCKENGSDPWQRDRQLMCFKYGRVGSRNDMRNHVETNEFRQNASDYTWEVYEQPSDPCALWCRGFSKFGGEEVLAKVMNAVPDGTRCYKSSSNICVQGSCYSVGCDNILGTVDVVDECGFCGGRGYQMVTSTGQYCTYSTRYYERRGQKHVVWIRGDFGVCSDNCGTGVQTTEMRCYNLTMNDYVDRVHCKHIEFKPKMLERVCHREPCDFKWMFGEWKICTVDCGNGTQDRDVYCAIENPRANDSTPLRIADYYCNKKKIPHNMKTCNGEQCITIYEPYSRKMFKETAIQRVKNVIDPGMKIIEFQRKEEDYQEPDITVRKIGEIYYKTGEWTLCSQKCKQGIRTRDIKCINWNGYEIDMHMDFCNKLKAPVTTEHCMDPCGKVAAAAFEWRYRKHLGCNSSCGFGVRKPIFICINLAKERPTIDRKCKDVKKPFTRDKFCDGLTRQCEAKWVLKFGKEFGPCTKTCGGGSQLRAVHCRRITPLSSIKTHNVRVDDEECTSKMPARKRECNTHNCAAYWLSEKFTTCSKTCGKGFKTRNVHCTQWDVKLEQEIRVKESECNNVIEPKHRRSCNEGPCATKAPRPKSYITEDVNTTFIQLIPQRRVFLLVGGSAYVSNITSVTVKCTCKNFKRRNIVWLRNNQIVGSKMKRGIKSNRGYLYIKSGRMDNQGLYLCKAGNIMSTFVLEYITKEKATDMMLQRLGRINVNQEFVASMKAKYEKRNKARNKKKNKPHKKARPSKVFTLTSVKRINRGFKGVPFKYYTGKFGKCSKNCGMGGVMYRDIFCELVFDSYLLRVSFHHCKAAIAGYPPLESVDCMVKKDCPYWWAAEWETKCSYHECIRPNVGSQERAVKCRDFETSFIIDPSHCDPATKPSRLKECNNSMCYVTWEMSKWGYCYPSCSIGNGRIHKRTRTVSCTWATGHSAHGAFCRPLKIPVTMETCAVRACLDKNCRDRHGRPNKFGYSTLCRISANYIFCHGAKYMYCCKSCQKYRGIPMK